MEKEIAIQKLFILQASAMSSLSPIKYYRAVERLDTLKDLKLLSFDEMAEFHRTNDQIRVAIEQKKARK